MLENSDELIFADDHGEDANADDSCVSLEKPWKILIVDDEPDIHTVTQIALAGFTYDNRGLHFFNAYSGAQAKKIIEENDDIALILLDVVMESDDAGLQVAKYIRETVKNRMVRIILRTGQPGQAPEEKVILDYDINDYKTKTELTSKKLFTAVVTSLRNYKDIDTINTNKKGLEKIIEATATLFELKSMEKFVDGVLIQLVSLLNLNKSSMYCNATSFMTAEQNNEFYIIAATGEFAKEIEKPAKEVLSDEVLDLIEKAVDDKKGIYTEKHSITYFRTENNSHNIVYIQHLDKLNEWDRNLVEIFCTNVAMAFDNLYINQQLEQRVIERTAELEKTNKKLKSEIVERKKIEMDLQESQRTLSNLMGNLPGMAYRCKDDKDWHVEFVSEGSLELTGYQPFEFFGQSKSFRHIIHPDDIRVSLDEIKVAIKNTRKFNLIYRIVCADKSEKWVLEQGLGVFTQTGELLSIEGFITDITDRKKYEYELEQAKTKEAELFLYREKYHTQQQENAFKKQIKIIKDELSYIDYKDVIFDSFYKPLDILSGDTYGTVDLGDGKYLLYIVDAMGKGLSASVTSILSISFLNYAFERSIEENDFSFEKNLSSYIKFIKRQLLDDEILCGTFILYDVKEQRLSFANYGMPPMLAQLKDGKLLSIRNNNQPIMQYFDTVNIDTISIENIDKLLFFSDGLNENSTNDGRPYEHYLHEDFLSSFSKNDLIKKIRDKTSVFEDDLTLIFIRNGYGQHVFQKDFSISSSTADIEILNEEVENLLIAHEFDMTYISEIMLTLNELLMNALEHGNLGITWDLKQELIKNDRYDDYIKELSSDEEHRKKKIRLSFNKLQKDECDVVRIVITDEGEGFDAGDMLKGIRFRQNERFHGRGLEMSRGLMDGIFYNLKGNEVTIIKSICKT